MKFLFSLLCVLVFSCGKVPQKTYSIGVDPSFFPMNLREQALNTLAFSEDILTEIARDQHVRLTRVNRSWDNLIDGLTLKKYPAILSSLPPNLINKTKFSFSEPLLHTGVVLVVPSEHRKLSLDSLNGQLVLIGQSNEEIELMKTYPNVDFTFYTNTATALDDVASGKVKGALIPILIATAYLKDLFQGSLTIASPLLTSHAIRLVALKGRQEPLIDLFNQGLHDLEQRGTYASLLSKWSLAQ